MPHDHNGALLREGDRVIVSFIVKSLTAEEGYCNCTLVTELGRRPDEQKETWYAVNTGVTVLAPAEPLGQPDSSAFSSDFGGALSALKAGYRVRRRGWNGKGMWLTLSPGGLVPAEKFWARGNVEFAASQPGCHAEVLPYITMKTADDKIVPWLASQTDMLCEDWEVVTEPTESLAIE